MAESDEKVRNEIKAEARRRKAARSRKRMITLAVVLSIIIVVAAAAVIIYLNVRSSSADTSTTSTALEEGSVNDETTSTTTLTSVPNLAGLFGKTTDQAVTALGSKATLSGVAAASDPANPNVVSLATVLIAPDQQSTSAKSTTEAADVYLSIDANGQVIGVLYSAPLDNIGYGYALFKNLLADSDFVVSTLTSAGCKVNTFAPQVPVESAYQTMSTDASGNQVLSKESYTYSGQTGLTTAPTNWSITYTYDYSISTVSGQPEDATRSIRIALT